MPDSEESGLEENGPEKSGLEERDLEEEVLDKRSLDKRDLAQIQIEQLEIDTVIGRGANSIVFKAKQLLLDRIVAVKVLTARGFSETQFSRFKKEVKLSSMIDHPNIAKIFAAGLTKNGLPYIQMELIEGYELGFELAENLPLKFSRFSEVFLPLLSALDYAHALGIFHLDLKPANIMISENAKTVKLLDFGIARLASTENPGTQTATYLHAGTPAYMSPEQCKGASPDHRSDLYSLSCIMYEALFSAPPFAAESAYELMSKHLHEKPPQAKELAGKSRVPLELAKTILWGLEKDPEARPQSARELSEKLSKILAETTENSAPVSVSAGKKNIQPLPISISLVFLLLLSFASYKILAMKKTQQESEKTKAELGDESIEKLLDKARIYKDKGDYANEFEQRERVFAFQNKLKRKKNNLDYINNTYEAARSACDQARTLKESGQNGWQLYAEKTLEYCSIGLSCGAGRLEDKDLYKTLCYVKLGALFLLEEKAQAIKELRIIHNAAKKFKRHYRLSTCLLCATVPVSYGVYKEPELLLLEELAYAEQSKTDVSDRLNFPLQIKAALSVVYLNQGEKERARRLALETAGELTATADLESWHRQEVLAKVLSVLAACNKQDFERAYKLELSQNADIYRRDFVTAAVLQTEIAHKYFDFADYKRSYTGLKEAISILEHFPDRGKLSQYSGGLSKMIACCQKLNKPEEAKIYEKKLKQLYTQ